MTHPTHSYKHFQYCKKGKTFYAEMSDLGPDFDGDYAMFYIKGKRMSVLFGFDRVEITGLDARDAIYISECGTYKVVLWND